MGTFVIVRYISLVLLCIDLGCEFLVAILGYTHSYHHKVFAGILTTCSLEGSVCPRDPSFSSVVLSMRSQRHEIEAGLPASAIDRQSAPHMSPMAPQPHPPPPVNPPSTPPPVILQIFVDTMYILDTTIKHPFSPHSRPLNSQPKTSCCVGTTISQTQP